MTIAPCPHDGGGCDLAREKNEDKHGFPWEWRVSCRCGYCSPFDADKDEAVRRHNKISQNCGAV
jgi:hypothetical protein